jgi:hypothetical protein
MRDWTKNKTNFLVVSIVTWAVLVGAIRAQFDAGSYAPSSPGKIAQVLPHNSTVDSTYSIGSYPLYTPVLLPGDGRQETETYCNSCHSTLYIAMQPPLPVDTWTAEVTKMEKTYGAQIPDDVNQKILHYLQSHYTIETRKH